MERPKPPQAFVRYRLPSGLVIIAVRRVSDLPKYEGATFFGWGFKRKEKGK